jgi:hypothetical protein
MYNLIVVSLIYHTHTHKQNSPTPNKKTKCRCGRVEKSFGRTKTKTLRLGNGSTRKSSTTEWAIAQAQQALQSTTQVWVGRCGGHCSRIPANEQSVGRRPSSFVECLLISHFLIAVAFLFVIIQWTARFNEQIRSCPRRLAYLPAAIPDFDFLINTDLRALRGRIPKSFFQLFQTLDSQLDFRLS